MEGSVVVLIWFLRFYFGVISSLFGFIWTDFDIFDHVWTYVGRYLCQK